MLGSYKVFDGMINLAIPATKKQAIVDSGHRFDADRHWAASLTLGFSTFSEGNKRITRMSKAQHCGLCECKGRSTQRAAMAAAMSTYYTRPVA